MAKRKHHSQADVDAFRLMLQRVYGPNWLKLAANLYGISAEQMRHWVYGKRPMPSNVWWVWYSRRGVIAQQLDDQQRIIRLRVDREHDARLQAFFEARHLVYSKLPPEDVARRPEKVQRPRVLVIQEDGEFAAKDVPAVVSADQPYKLRR
jgi:hypothetical protein